jgi:succinate dehydrogenase/fumarate reductase flavoprotein subunit
MATPEIKTENISTDILIIGGGVSGLTAAITAKEQFPDLKVLVVDKAVASKGWAGKGTRTAGLISYVTQEDDPEEFVRYCVENLGYYANDQDLLRELAFSSRMLVENIEKWGGLLLKDDNNKIDYAKWPFPFGTAGIDPDLTLAFSKHAKKLGITFLDRVCVVDLLKDGERVSGACGFSIVDGTFYTLTASSVILASGTQGWNITPHWPETGLGIAAAYRAGAQMRNADFCNFFDFARVDQEHGWLYYGSHSGSHTAHDHLYNKHGENISQKYRPGLHTSTDALAIYIWYKETIAGNGPITADLKAFYEGGGGQFFKFHPKAFERYMRQHTIANFPHDTMKFEVVPGFLGELCCIRVDHSMMTTVPGLFGAGDIVSFGSARTGAGVHIHGTGFLNALFTSTKAGSAAAIAAKVVKGTGVKANVRADVTERIKKNTFAPLYRKDGVSPRDVIHAIQDIMAPVDYSVIKTESKMMEALSKLQEIRQELPLMAAQDFHELTKCIDAESMSICTEIFYKSSLERKETRGWHFRLDYPEMDNEHFLKWVVVQKVNDEMKVSLEDIPIHSYRYQPK